MSGLNLIRLLDEKQSFHKLKMKYDRLVSEGVNINYTDRDQNTLLIKSIKLGFYKFTKLLLCNDKIDINCRNSNGLTPITVGLFHMDDISYQKQICKLLIKKGADLDIEKYGNITPLIYAIQKGDLEIVKLLLSVEKRHNYKNHITSKRTTPLMEALCNEKFDIVKLLLKSHNNPGIYHKDIDGNCALLYACMYGNLEIIKLLLRDRNMRVRNNNNETPLILCLKNNSRDVINYILSKSNIDINCTDIYGSNSVTLCCRMGYLEELKTLIRLGVKINLNSGFIDACKFGQIDILKLLLDNKVKTNYLNNDGQSGFMLACSNGYIEIVKLLLEKNNKIKDDLNFKHMTALMYSCISNRIDIVKLLINNKVDLNKKDLRGFSALMYALNDNNIEIVELLLDNGVKVDTISENCIKNCIKEGYESLVNLLILRGYNNISNEKLLFLGISHNMYNLCKLILSRGNINLNYFENDVMSLNMNDRLIYLNLEHTFLIAACKNNNFDLVRLLIDYNVNVNTVVNERNTAFTLYIYTSKPKLDICKLLLSKTDFNNNQNVLINICNSLLCISDKLDLINFVKDKVDIHLSDNYGKRGLDYIFDKFTRVIYTYNNYILRLKNYDELENYLKTIFLLKRSEGELKILLLKIVNKCCTGKLIEFGKKVLRENILDKKYILFESCENNYIGIVRLLINEGYNINCVREDGKSGLDIAISNNYKILVEVLLSNGSYLSYKKLNEYKAYKNDILEVLENYELELKDKRKKNLDNLILMKKTNNTTFGGKILISDNDIKRYIVSFM
jgi:ankyrin repeat protein